MGKLLAFVVSGAIGFYVAFGWSSGLRDDAEAHAGGEEGLQHAQCVRQFERHAGSSSVADGICGCMLKEFAYQGYAITDTFGSDYSAMQAITRDCAARYGVVAGG